MSRRWMQAGLVTAVLALAGAALADDLGNDEVTLKNGGSVRGTVVSVEPGTNVKIIEVGEKTPRVIPWGQVADVEKGKYAPKTTVQPGPAGPGYGALPAGRPIPPPEPKVGDQGVVKLHVESPLEARILAHDPPAVGRVGGYVLIVDRAQNVCVSPCDKVVDGSAGHTFTIHGEFPTPEPFSLSQHRGDMTLKLEPGSNGMRTGGAWATVFGALGVLGGAITLPLAYGIRSHASPAMRLAGIGQLGAGIPLLGGGIALLILGKSSYTLQPSAPTTGAIKPRYWLGEF